MFSKVTLLATLSFVLSVAAGGYECSTGTMNCCESVHEPHGKGGEFLLEKSAGTIQTQEGSIGFVCNPMTGIGASTAANCVSQVVCCIGNTFNGVVTVGCSPASVQL